MADSTEILKKYKQIIDTLHRLAECPVCLDRLNTPFKLCSRGHMMCCSCVESLKVCPTCEAEFSIETPVGVKNLLEALPKFCRYSSDGCQDVVVNGSDHETFCGFRPETCKHCESVLPLTELLKHYECKHPQRPIFTEEVIDVFWCIDPNRTLKKTPCLPIYLYNNFFWIVIKNDVQEKQLKFWVKIAPSGKPLTDYYARVKFKNNNFSYSYTLKAFMSPPNDKSKESSVTVVKNQNIKGEAENADVYCMKVPTAELDNLINEEDELHCNIKFFKINS